MNFLIFLYLWAFIISCSVELSMKSSFIPWAVSCSFLNKFVHLVAYALVLILIKALKALEAWAS